MMPDKEKYLPFLASGERMRKKVAALFLNK
jgi:hypothetical protein